jgi:PST family polysaccharide transporter
MTKLNKIKEIIFHNKVAENYFSMTFLQGANLLIGLLLYPYLIRVLGKEAYGTYIFAFSIISFFIMFVSFGFDIPALKQVALHPNDLSVKRKIVSAVFTGKLLFLGLAIVVFSILLHILPVMQKNTLLYLVIFALVLPEILFPVWYFQATQNMKVVTIIQIGIRLLSIPLFFIFIKSPADLLIYAAILSIAPVLGAILAIVYLKKKDNIGLRIVNPKEFKSLFWDSVPFFMTYIFGSLKKEAVTLVIGSFFGMSDVAIYDLANKIITIPRLLTQKINDAIFPKIVGNATSEKVKKIISYETILSLFVIAAIILFGYWAVLLLGGKTMLSAYPLAVILSGIIFSWLRISSYLNFVFVPKGKYIFVTKNQAVGLISFLILGGMSLFIYKSIFIVVAAYVLSSLVEILYCKYLINKYKLL